MIIIKYSVRTSQRTLCDSSRKVNRLNQNVANWSSDISWVLLCPFLYACSVLCLSVYSKTSRSGVRAANRYLNWYVPMHASHSRRPCFTFTDTLTHKSYIVRQKATSRAVIFVKSLSRSSTDYGIPTALLNFGIHYRLYNTQLVVADLTHCNAVQTLKPYFIAINFNITLQVSIACIKQQIQHRNPTSVLKSYMIFVRRQSSLLTSIFDTVYYLFLQITSWKDGDSTSYKRTIFHWTIFHWTPWHRYSQSLHLTKEAKKTETMWFATDSARNNGHKDLPVYNTFSVNHTGCHILCEMHTNAEKYRWLSAVFSVSYRLNLKKEFGVEHIILDGSTLIKVTLGLP
jgi:hypothetical protein